MMVVWQGWGFLAAVSVLVAGILVQSAVNGIFGAHTYEENSTSWMALVLLLSALVVWPLGRRLNTQAGQVLIDPSTGQEMVLRRQHTFFFVKMEYWALVMVGGAVIALVAGLLGG